MLKHVVAIVRMMFRRVAAMNRIDEHVVATIRMSDK